MLHLWTLGALIAIGNRRAQDGVRAPRPHAAVDRKHTLPRHASAAFAGPNTAQLGECGDRSYEEGRFEAARILYLYIKNYGRLASCLVHLGRFGEAVDAARRANSPATWREVRRSSLFPLCTWPSRCVSDVPHIDLALPLVPPPLRIDIGTQRTTSVCHESCAPSRVDSSSVGKKTHRAAQHDCASHPGASTVGTLNHWD
jgi:hypothetical protein